MPSSAVSASVAAELEGSLLVSSSHFPYFMLVALEAGGALRALVLLALSPILWLLQIVQFDNAALRIMIFISTAGIKTREIKAVAKATLLKFYLEDLREEAYGVWARCSGEKYVIASTPRVMVEPFLREYLDADFVVATELREYRGYCLGVPAAPGVILGASHRSGALRAAVGEMGQVDVGLGGGFEEELMLLCRKRHSCFRSPAITLRRDCYPKPLIFHDGRLVGLPTPLATLSLLFWLPLAFPLALFRIASGFLPHPLPAAAALGFRIRSSPPPPASSPPFLFASSHRTLIDPVIISATLRRPVAAVTYSLSRVSELLSPIPTRRLRRDRALDGDLMSALLRDGATELVVCPEGTTCREPYLLRFSPLFAEVAKRVIPVAVAAEATWFHGTTARGWKGLDALWFLANPWPSYAVEYLEEVAGGVGGRDGRAIANDVQRRIAAALGYRCTDLTRRDKYRMLAGNDGV